MNPGDGDEIREIREIRASRPREVGVARILLAVSVVLWLPIAGYLQPSTQGALGIAFVLAVFGSFGAVRGRQGGRTMVAVCLTVCWFFLLPYCVAGFASPEAYDQGYAAIDLAATASSVAALVLLHRPAVNDYVRRVSVARHPQRRS